MSIQKHYSNLKRRKPLQNACSKFVWWSSDISCSKCCTLQQWIWSICAVFNFFFVNIAVDVLDCPECKNIFYLKVCLISLRFHFHRSDEKKDILKHRLHLRCFFKMKKRIITNDKNNSLSEKSWLFGMISNLRTLWDNGISSGTSGHTKTELLRE